MKYLYIFLFLAIFGGCTTLNKALIENASQDSFQPLVLIPDYDVYDVRVDIIRQTESSQVDDGATGSAEVSYHSVGFHLGNGLFFDLNNNLSLLVPKLLNIDGHEDFKIQQNQEGPFVNSTITYEKRDSLFLIKSSGLLRASSKKIILIKDSVVSVKEGLLSRYKIIKSDSSIIYRAALSNKEILKNEEGYFYKTLLGKKEYKQIDNEVHIGRGYTVRNSGDMIEIFSRGLLNNEYLSYKIIKSGNKLFVYDRNYRGLEITMDENEILIKENARKRCSYTLK